MKDTPYGGGPSRRLLAALGIVVVAVIAFLLGRVSSDDSAPKRPETANAPITEPGPTRELNGVPVGYAQTEAGAVEAASNFARHMSGVEGTDDAYRESLVALAAPEWRSEAGEVARNTMAFLREHYGEGATATYSPLRYRVVACSSETCRVQLWGVTVVFGQRDQLDESWSTVTLELQWVDEDWRIAAQTSQPGPAPRLLQDQEGAQPNRLSQFQEFLSGPAP